MNKRIAFLTLGCKVNLYDTEAMKELFEQRGYTTVEFDEVADVYLINTCTVTNFGDKKSRQMIRRAKRLNPKAIVVATGCYAQVADKEVAAIEGINIVIGTKNRREIVDTVEEYTVESGVVNRVESLKGEREFEPLEISSLTNRTRAYIKIQEGCNRFCSYCIIPYARGPIRSRKPEDVVAEVKRLADNGFKEVVLAGIHVASYGLDMGDISLADIIERVNEVDGIERIRFSSMEPLAVTDEFVARMKAMPKVCHHYHLSLQSGCDRTLKRMNRRYTAEQYFEACQRLRAAFPDVAITTDIIVGFPGETDRDYRECVDFARRVHLDKIHVFPYSPKKGTPAAVMPEQVSPEVKNERAADMLKVSDSLNYEFLEAQRDKLYDVLFEECEEGNNKRFKFSGHTSNYIKVLVESDEDLHNRIVRVRLTDVVAIETMTGELV